MVPTPSNLTIMQHKLIIITTRMLIMQQGAHTQQYSGASYPPSPSHLGPSPLGTSITGGLAVGPTGMPLGEWTCVVQARTAGIHTGL